MAPTPHVLKGINPKSKDFDHDEAVTACRKWLSGEFGKTNCLQLYNRKKTTCDCMKFLTATNPPTSPGLLDAVAEYMLHWVALPRATQYELLHEWMKVAEFVDQAYPSGEKSKRLYRVPTLGLVGGAGMQHSICKNGLCGLLCVGRRIWKTAAKEPSARAHALNGKGGASSSRGKEMAEVNESLKLFFEELSEEGLPFATRIIRDETGMTTRDDEPDAVTLPPHITKRGCYEKWCFSRGWKITKRSTAKTIYKSSKDYMPREIEAEDEDGISLWPPGSTYGKVVSWPKFLKYWRTEYPKVMIRKKGADTCTDCLILRNEFRLFAARRKRKAAEDDARDEDEDGDSNSDMDISDGESERGDDDIDREEGDFKRSLSNFEKTSQNVSFHLLVLTSLLTIFLLSFIAGYSQSTWGRT